MDKDLISIVVPIYNAQKYLDKCIKSLVNQTYSEIEILLIDDGSFDESSVICNKYLNLDTRIRYISKENEGVSATRNKGIKLAQGKWIMFVDADDWIEENTCEEYSKLFNMNYDIILSKSILYDDKHGGKKGFYKYDKDIIVNEGLKKKLISYIFYESKNFLSFIETPWGKIYKRDFLIDNNIYFKEELPYGEDGFFNFIAFNFTNKIYIKNVYTYNYRVNDSSVTHSFRKNFIELHERLLKTYKNSIFYSEYKKYEPYYVIRKFEGYLNEYFFNNNNKDNYLVIKKEILELLKKDIYKDSLIRSKNLELSLKRKLIVFFAKHRMVMALKIITNLWNKKQMLDKLKYNVHNKKE